MSDNRRVAGVLMKDAWETISKKRHGIHGSAENSFEMIGDLWGVYMRHARRVRGHDRVLPEDVAEMMAMLKKVRKMYGDPLNVDNDVDDLGYTALAGMLRLPDLTKDKDAQINEGLDKLDPLQPGDGATPVDPADHEHVPARNAIPDADGFVPCAIEDCGVKVQVQVRKPKNPAKGAANG